MTQAEKVVKDILKEADIKIGGKRPQDITVHDDRFYARALSQRVLGVGESYMDGWWDANELDVMMSSVIAANIGEKVKPSMRLVVAGTAAHLRNQQTLKKPRKMPSTITISATICMH